MPGGSLVELSVLTREYFRSRPCCVKTVVLEPDFSFLDILRQPNSVRAIRLFDLTNAIAFYRYVSSYNQQPIPVLSAFDYLGSIGSATARHYTNIGIFHSSRSLSAVNYRHQTTLRGFVGAKGSFAEALAKDASAQTNYYDALDMISKVQGTPNLISQYQFEVFWSLVSYIEQQGANVILLRMPQLAHWPYSAGFVADYSACSGNKPPLIDFGNPRANEVVFDPRNRIDLDHLNEDGAAIFSAALARRLSALLDSGAVKEVGKISCQDGSR